MIMMKRTCGDFPRSQSAQVEMEEDFEEPFKVDPYSTRIVNNILLKSSYFPRMPLGIGMKKSLLLPIPKKIFSFRLRYKPTKEELESHDAKKQST